MDSEDDWSPEDLDFVPEDLTDLKMRIKVSGGIPRFLHFYCHEYHGRENNNVYKVTGTGKGRKGEKPTRDLRAEAAEDESDEEDERIFSNNYNDVCKFACDHCGDEVDTDKLKKHMAEVHNSATAGEEVLGEGSRYQKKTWHRCGICGKEV